MCLSAGNFALDRPFCAAYKARNESSGEHHVAQYYYGSDGSGAGAVLSKNRGQASGHGPLRAFFIAPNE
jgi:hypothetical protein